MGGGEQNTDMNKKKTVNVIQFDHYVHPELET